MLQAAASLPHGSKAHQSRRISAPTIHQVLEAVDARLQAPDLQHRGATGRRAARHVGSVLTLLASLPVELVRERCSWLSSAPARPPAALRSPPPQPRTCSLQRLRFTSKTMGARCSQPPTAARPGGGAVAPSPAGGAGAREQRGGPGSRPSAASLLCSAPSPRRAGARTRLAHDLHVAARVRPGQRDAAVPAVWRTHRAGGEAGTEAGGEGRRKRRAAWLARLTARSAAGQRQPAAPGHAEPVRRQRDGSRAAALAQRRRAARRQGGRPALRTRDEGQLFEVAPQRGLHRRRPRSRARRLKGRGFEGVGGERWDQGRRRGAQAPQRMQPGLGPVPHGRQLRVRPPGSTAHLCRLLAADAVVGVQVEGQRLGRQLALRGMIGHHHLQGRRGVRGAGGGPGCSGGRDQAAVGSTKAQQAAGSSRTTAAEPAPASVPAPAPSAPPCPPAQPAGAARRPAASPCAAAPQRPPPRGWAAPAAPPTARG